MVLVPVVRGTSLLQRLGGPGAAASEVEYAGRDYRRSRDDVLVLPAGTVPLGRTDVGDVVYGPPTTGTVPTVLHVVVDGDVVQYGLVGGP